MTVAGSDAGLAGGALVESDFEGVLLALAGLGKGDEVAVVAGEVGFAIVLVGEFGDGGVEFFLIGEEVVDEGFLWREAGHVVVEQEMGRVLFLSRKDAKSQRFLGVIVEVFFCELIWLGLRLLG